MATSKTVRARKARTRTPKKVSPMMQQYLSIKAQYEDAILFFRVGDFYEMFLDDAETAAKALDIVLTSRDKDSPNPIPFCGVPHHAARTYVQRLIDQGFKVAICDQVEDARKAKGIVKREVVRVVTPGLVLDEEGLDARAPAYLCAVARGKGRFGVAFMDVTTGELIATEVDTLEEAAQELDRQAPREVLVPDDDSLQPLLDRLIAPVPQTVRPAATFARKRATGTLCEQLCVTSLDGQGLAEMPQAVGAAGAIVEYAREAAKTVLRHVTRVRPYHRRDVLVLDEATRRNLELVESAQGGRSGSLLAVIDKTSTSMGSRQLRAWLSAPLRDPVTIEQRLAAVAALREDRLRREELRALLAGVADLERIIGRVATGLASPRDLGQLATSLRRLPGLRKSVRALDADASLLGGVAERLDPCDELAAEIGRALVDDPPAKLSDGHFIRAGYHDGLDEVLEITRDGKSWIAKIESRERERTGITSLKVRYNKVFGYYIEVTKANLSKVPEEYQRKQTTATSERYFTKELKELEDKILGAEDRRTTLELEIFDRLRETVASAAPRVQATARAVAELDVLTGLAELADTHDYCRPEVHDGFALEIVDGRHPVVERMDLGERFVPNDISLDEERRLLLITGPNMAGKSTVMRQTALIVLLAQMGSFVPAREARIGAVDRIFTRVGASDLLARGQSTFMVEMSETANILNNATAHSLVIVDEIGRGTSTFDGVSIAWAVAEDLHDRIGAKTLFATHYHELTDLPDMKGGAANVSVAVKEWNDQIIFLRKLAKGATSRSYGIQVARLAGLPTHVLDRAHEVLVNLESGEHDAVGTPRIARGGSRDTPTDQLNLFGAASAPHVVLTELESLDLDGLSPREALAVLYELKSKL